jgi:hypothetical protein
VLQAELTALLAEIERGSGASTPARAAVHLRAIADALDRGRAERLAERLARVTPRPLLVMAAAVAIAAINTHDRASLR